jgi:hypothetical protein
MKKLIVIFLLTSFAYSYSIAQDKLYLLFEFMKVDEEQASDYAETEAFWEKIHQQRVNNGDIIGWDLWSLQPGGEGQGFQYLTVQLYNDPVKMMNRGSWDDLLARAKAAYPDMKKEDLMKKINKSAKTRDLAARVYLEQIATTTGDFDMPIGTVASLDLMKATMGDWDKYEKAEKEIFQPNHQKQVDAGKKASWALLRFMSPIGSDTYASHITVNMYKDWNQVFSNPWDGGGSDMTDEQMKAVEEGIASRDMKWVYMATLERKVRK